MKFQQTNITSIIKEIRKKNLNSYYFLDELFVEYLISYYPKSEFKDVSFIITDNDNFVLCPVTIEIKNSIKYLNFFGQPFLCIFLKRDENIFSFFKEKLKELIIKENIHDINFMIEERYINSIKQENILKKNFFKKVSYTKHINLIYKIDEISKNFSKGLKHLLNKNYQNLSYKIIDNENYHSQILEMKKMHEEISKKITRSNQSWLLNEKMILNNKAFLVQVSDLTKVISYSLFFYNGRESCYFSSCTYRDLFKDYKNISHRSIFKAIQYLSKKNCKDLILGETKILYSKHKISDKEKNIGVFKSSFGGEKYLNYFLDKDNLDLVDVYLK